MFVQVHKHAAVNPAALALAELRSADTQFGSTGSGPSQIALTLEKSLKRPERARHAGQHLFTEAACLLAKVWPR